jgi:stearoyl-CoA desaturase (delta-9 desaturase)
MPDESNCRQHGPAEYFSLSLLLAMHTSCLLVFFVPCTLKLVSLALGGYVLRMFGITAGYHRYLSHRAFRTSRVFQFVLALLGTSSMQNGPIWWASWHRHHHRFTDAPQDAHSPKQYGFWHAHIGWILEPGSDHPDLSNVRDLMRFPELVFLEKHKWLPLIAYAIACFAIAGLPGLLWGFVLSSVVLLHATALINSAGHVWGSRRYPTQDTSRNNALLALITLGEGWHNNHHHVRHCARQGFFWWELDMTYYVLCVLSWFGVIWDVRVPSQKALRGPLVSTFSGAL